MFFTKGITRYSSKDGRQRRHIINTVEIPNEGLKSFLVYRLHAFDLISSLSRVETGNPSHYIMNHNWDNRTMPYSVQLVRSALVNERAGSILKEKQPCWTITAPNRHNAVWLSMPSEPRDDNVQGHRLMNNMPTRIGSGAEQSSPKGCERLLNLSGSACARA